MADHFHVLLAELLNNPETKLMKLDAIRRMSSD
jgi:hypothetical protein